MNVLKTFIALCCIVLALFSSCKKEDGPVSPDLNEWQRDIENPIFRDSITDESYQAASDPHVFFDDARKLKMIYSGDVGGVSSIKLASGSSWNAWSKDSPLLSEVGPSGLDVNKETSFYRKAGNGKHQIYYIGYEDENSYLAQIYLAEANSLEGPYTQMVAPAVANGIIAGKDVYCITSPSVVEHEGQLYITFIAWDAHPNQVTEVWIMGAVSSDQGHTWSGFQLVDTPIAMEGQLTQMPDGTFVAVRTSNYEGKEAIFYATSDHPFGPWTSNTIPILVQKGAPFEKDEIIAPQITIDPLDNTEYLYYTGADYQIGWWTMLARKP